MIAQLLWQQIDARLAALEVEGVEGTEAYVSWDEIVLEKPESHAAEGFCPLHLRKTGRLMARCRP